LGVSNLEKNGPEGFEKKGKVAGGVPAIRKKKRGEKEPLGGPQFTLEGGGSQSE